MKTINRWIVSDLLIAIAEGSLLFTFIFLLKRIYELTDLFVTGGTSLVSTLQLLFSILPTVMMLTFPMAILLASMMVYGRLAQDNELVALQAAGYSTRQLMAPALILGLALTCLLLWWGNRIAPKGLRLFEDMAANILQDATSAGIHPGNFNELGDYIIAPSSVDDDKTMRNIRMFEHNEDRIPTSISAKSGTLNYNTLNGNTITLTMTDGAIHQKSLNGSAMNILFDEFDFSIGIPRLLRKLASAAREEYKYRNKDLQFKIDSYESMSPEERKYPMNERWYYRSTTELSRRVALPFACLIMALLGSLLGIISGRGKRSSCYAVSVSIIFVYYILLNFGKNFVHSGAVPAYVGLWIPNTVAILFGAYLYYRTYRV